jgi:hypothetical protein
VIELFCRISRRKNLFHEDSFTLVTLSQLVPFVSNQYIESISEDLRRESTFRKGDDI